MTIRASNNILISESRKNVDPKENKIVYDHEKVTVSRGHTQVFHCILTGNSIIYTCKMGSL